MQSYWFDSSYIQITPYNYWRLYTNQETITLIFLNTTNQTYMLSSVKENYLFCFKKRKKPTLKWSRFTKKKKDHKDEPQETEAQDSEVTCQDHVAREQETGS